MKRLAEALDPGSRKATNSSEGKCRHHSSLAGFLPVPLEPLDDRAGGDGGVLGGTVPGQGAGVDLDVVHLVGCDGHRGRVPLGQGHLAGMLVVLGLGEEIHGDWYQYSAIMTM